MISFAPLVGKDSEIFLSVFGGTLTKHKDLPWIVIKLVSLGLKTTILLNKN